MVFYWTSTRDIEYLIFDHSYRGDFLIGYPCRLKINLFEFQATIRVPKDKEPFFEIKDFPAFS